MRGKKIMGERLSKSQRLEAELEDLILHGSYRVYDRFLSVSKLKKRYRASQATVVSALEHLEARGLIFRRSRSGIFVSPTSRTKEILIVSSASRAVSNELNQFSYGLGESPCASKAGWVTINCTAEDFEEYLPNLRIICKKLFAVVFFRCPDVMLRHHQALEERNVFHMFYGSSSAARQLNGCRRYCYNEKKLVAKALDALYEKGHRRIGCFSCSGTTFEERTECYRAWMREKGLSFSEQTVHILPDGEDGYAFMMKRLAGGDPGCSAFFCTSNHGLGSGLLQALRDKRISVPGEMAVLGVGDIETARMLRPRLAAIDIDYERDANALIDLFASSTEDGIAAHGPVLGKSSFIITPGGSL